MASFQLAGSLVLLLFGLRMVLGKVIEDAQAMPETATPMQRAIFPLAIPGIAGAGAIMTVMLLTDNKVRSFAEQVETTGILALCTVLLFGVFASAGLISRLLGRPGIEIVSRVFGLILASIAITSMIVAIKLSFGLA
jgi:multiple antibiotic resistance protein